MEALKTSGCFRQSVVDITKLTCEIREHSLKHSLNPRPSPEQMQMTILEIRDHMHVLGGEPANISMQCNFLVHMMKKA